MPHILAAGGLINICPFKHLPWTPHVLRLHHAPAVAHTRSHTLSPRTCPHPHPSQQAIPRQIPVQADCGWQLDILRGPPHSQGGARWAVTHAEGLCSHHEPKRHAAGTNIVWCGCLPHPLPSSLLSRYSLGHTLDPCGWCVLHVMVCLGDGDGVSWSGMGVGAVAWRWCSGGRLWRDCGAVRARRTVTTPTIPWRSSLPTEMPPSWRNRWGQGGRGGV